MCASKNENIYLSSLLLLLIFYAYAPRLDLHAYAPRLDRGVQSSIKLLIILVISGCLDQVEARRPRT